MPDGRALVAGADLVFEPGVATYVSGPSGSGKSTLFRAIAGIWPYGAGRITVLDRAHVTSLVKIRGRGLRRERVQSQIIELLWVLRERGSQGLPLAQYRVKLAEGVEAF